MESSMSEIGTVALLLFASLVSLEVSLLIALRLGGDKALDAFAKAMADLLKGLGQLFGQAARLLPNVRPSSRKELEDDHEPDEPSGTKPEGSPAP
jgi:hypothetical protein